MGLFLKHKGSFLSLRKCFLQNSMKPVQDIFNQYPVQGRLARTIQALIEHVLLCVGGMINYQFGLFLFSET